MSERLEFLGIVIAALLLIVSLVILGYALGVSYGANRFVLPPMECASTQGGYVVCIQEPAEELEE